MNKALGKERLFAWDRRSEYGRSSFQKSTPVELRLHQMIASLFPCAQDIECYYEHLVQGTACLSHLGLSPAGQVPSQPEEWAQPTTSAAAAAAAAALAADDDPCQSSPCGPHVAPAKKGQARQDARATYKVHGLLGRLAPPTCLLGLCLHYAPRPILENMLNAYGAFP